MKSKYLAGVSLISLAVSAMFAGCSQEEVASAPQPDGKNALSVNVTTQDFVDESGNGSRATTNDDANRTTVFVANDDAMGVYAFSADGTLYNNVKFTYTGEGWTGDETIYLYKNATYVAYFPYDETLTAQNIADEEAIKTAFSDGFSYSQSTPDAYEAADLMMAEAMPEDGVLNFQLQHQFAMVEINVPVRSYKTSSGFEYNAPFKMWYEDLKAGDNTVEPFNAGKGSLRFIVQPGTMDIVIDGAAFYDGDIPVNFDNEKNRNVTLEAGQFKQYNMKYDGVSSEVTTRDLEPGDYYYSDGSIYPYGKGDTEFNNPPTEGCIGVIFETTTGAPDTEWTHGSVLALVNAHKDWSAWGGQNEPFEGNNTAGFTDDTKRRNFLLSHMDGYQFTSLLAEGKGECAVTKVTSFGTGDYAAYAAPVPATSGWYMPSSGQYAALMEHLGGYAFTTDNVESTAGEYRDGKAAALAAIESALTKVGGYLWDSDGDTESFQRWWSSTESDNVNEWCIEWKRDGQIKLLTRNNTQSWNTPKTYARAVLSF